MTDIHITKDLCTGCGRCTELCPYGIITTDPQTHKAMASPQMAVYCSRCGHCSAICPVSAITISYEGMGPVPDTTGETLPSPGQISRLMTSRRSIREYTDQPVPDRTIEEILSIVRYAPTGMNGQSVNWMVINDPAKVRECAGTVVEWARNVLKNQPDHILAPILPMVIHAWEQGDDKICHGAPALIFAYGHKDNPVAYIDSIIALTHLDLAAPVFGLGTCWAGIVQIALDSSPDLVKGLGFPENYTPVYGMMIGYPRYTFPGIPARNKAQILWR